MAHCRLFQAKFCDQNLCWKQREFPFILRRSSLRNALKSSKALVETFPEFEVDTSTFFNPVLFVLAHGLTSSNFIANPSIYYIYINPSLSLSRFRSMNCNYEWYQCCQICWQASPTALAEAICTSFGGKVSNPLWWDHEKNFVYSEAVHNLLWLRQKHPQWWPRRNSTRWRRPEYCHAEWTLVFQGYSKMKWVKILDKMQVH